MEVKSGRENFSAGLNIADFKLNPILSP